MAQELVLIPKTKYDYLLVQSNNHKTPPEVNPNDSLMSGEKLNHHEKREGQLNKDSRLDVDKDSLTVKTDSPPTEKVERKLFIEKPLSKMNFSENMRSKKQSRAEKRLREENKPRGTKRKKKQWINYMV